MTTTLFKRYARALVGLLMMLGLIGAAELAAAPAASASTQVKLPARCKVHGRVLCADKTRHKLYYVKNGTIQTTLSAAFGRPGYATREGTFHIQSKRKHWVSTIYHSPMPDAMFFSGGQAVHYSAYYAADSRHKSHGCVNIRNRARLDYVYSQMRVGDRVVVYRS